ncbi:hypothetical protein PRIC2_003075 [Phytophthora ramorum]
MLSRVEDTRVFESSEDVILAASGRQCKLLMPQGSRRLQSPASEAAEDEQLHPQHPHRMRKRVLRRESSDFHQSAERQRLVPFSRHNNRPMEFVFLSSGEIRAREDCPPGLGLPKLQHEQDNGAGQDNPRLQYRAQELSDDGESEEEAEDDSDVEDNQGNGQRTGYEKLDRRRPTKQVKMSRQQVGRQPVDRQLNERFAPSLSASSGRSLSSMSDGADVSSDGESEKVVVASSMVSEESRQEKSPRAALGRQSRRQATRNAENQVRSCKNSAVSAARNGVKSTPTLSLKLDHLRIEEDGVPDNSTDQDRAAERTKTSHHEKPPSSEATPCKSRQRPAPLEQVSQSESTTDARTRRTKRSPKMKVSHLVSEEPTPEPKGRSTSTARREAILIDRLESELQKEKKRVLEKMTQLLDEQGKNQELRDRLEALEARVAAEGSDTSNKDREAAREQEERNETLEKEKTDHIRTLEEQGRLQETKIARLKHDKDQLKTALKQLTSAGISNDRRSDGEEAAVLKAELDDVTKRLQEFLAKVERWKSTSKETMQSCDDKVDLSALLEQAWLNFPQFAGVIASQHKEDPIPAPEQQQRSTGPDEQADAVVFLKKRLRQREDELRQTHVKYVELKELCARQCVREADLQNFINEHRLRGNLIIRRNSATKPSATPDNQAQTQEEPQEEHRQSAKLKMISSRGTNTPSLYSNRRGDEEQLINEEYSDNQEDNDDYEEEEYEYPVRTPKVFVQVGCDGVYEHASPSNSAVAQKLASDRSRGKRKTQPKQHQQRVERIRLVPSPSLAQQYERVATPTNTSTTARRRKSGQQPLGERQYAPQSSLVGDCPPGCGSRLSFTRKKTPSVAARKPIKRSVSTASLKGTVGVIRPWM